MSDSFERSILSNERKKRSYIFRKGKNNEEIFYFNFYVCVCVCDRSSHVYCSYMPNQADKKSLDGTTTKQQKRPEERKGPMIKILIHLYKIKQHTEQHRLPFTMQTHRYRTEM